VVVPASLVSGANSNSKTLTTDEYFQNFCGEIIKKYYFIRSAAIANDVGHFMATAYRRRLITLMTQEDSSRLLLKQQFELPHVTDSNQR
jgi:hypothetical protein